VVAEEACCQAELLKIARDMVETFRDQRRHELELGGSVRVRSGAPAG
jgi:hypothetical protein